MERGINVPRLCFMRRLRLCRESPLHSAQTENCAKRIDKQKEGAKRQTPRGLFLGCDDSRFGRGKSGRMQISECCNFRQKKGRVATTAGQLHPSGTKGHLCRSVPAPDYRQRSEAQMNKRMPGRLLKTFAIGI